MRTVALTLMLASCGQPAQPARGTGFPTTSEQRVLAAGATDRFALALKRGESATIVVMQQGVDVVVEAFAPDGAQLATIDSPNGRNGDEPVEIIAAGDGEHRLAVRALDATDSGRYTIAVTSRRDVAQTQELLADRMRARREATEWLRARSGAIALHDARVDGAGLARFDALWTRARIVGLGEATHGSRQFGDMRLALTRRAIEQHGVRVIGLEGSAARLRLVDRWTRDGAGDLATMIGTQWINRRAFTALATELRAWNLAHPTDPVTIVGLDDQDNASAREVVARVAHGFDAAYAGRIDDVLARVAAADAQALVFGPSDVSADDWKFLVELVPRMPTDAVDSARTLAQFAEFNSGAAGARSRDWLMAENLLRVIATRRAILWGHNAHVGHPDNRGDRATTGGRFAERGGYAVLALAFRGGGFLAQLQNDPQYRLRAFTVPAADAESIDGVLAPLGTAIVTWLDDRAAPPRWLTVARPMHWIGALAPDNPVPGQWNRPSLLLHDYDGVVVFDRVDAEPSDELGIDRAP